MNLINIKLIAALASTIFVSTAQAQETTAPVVSNTKVKEFGIGFNSLNSYSLQYRWGTEKRLFRIEGTIGGGYNDQNSNGTNLNYPTTPYQSKQSTPLNLSSSISFSIINLKPLNNNFGLMYGGSIGFQFITNKTISDYNQNNSVFDTSGAFVMTSQNLNNTTSSQFYTPQLGLVLGAYYKINSSFSIYGEIDPMIYYSRGNRNSSQSITYEPKYSYRNTSSSSSSISNDIGISNLSNANARLTLVYRFSK